MSNITQTDQELIMDKLSFTYPLSLLKRNRLLKRIQKEEFRSKFNIRTYRDNSKGSRYKNNYSIIIDGKNSIQISMYPINTNHNFIRGEINPNKLGKNGMIKLRKFLMKLLGFDVTETIYQDASITRIDLAVNLIGLEEDLYIHKDKSNYSSIQRSTTDGEIESQIAGGDDSSVRVTFYNKNLEQLDKGDGEVANPNGNYHRLEIRLRDLQLTMAQLDSSILDVFNSVNFYSADLLNDDWFSPQFREDVEEDGLNSALHSLRDSNARRGHLRRLHHHRRQIVWIDDLNFSKPHELLSFLIQKGSRQELLARLSH